MIKIFASIITYLLVSSICTIALMLGFGFLDFLIFDNNSATYTDYLGGPMSSKWRIYSYLCLSAGIGLSISLSISKYALFKSGLLTKNKAAEFFGK
jgi:hypothetical protein